MATSGVYEFDALIGWQAGAGTQGIQFGIQSTVTGATVQGRLMGQQVNQAINAATTSARIIATGTQGFQSGIIASSIGSTELKGIIRLAGSGSPQIAIQCRALQSSVSAYIRPDSYIKITRIS